MRASLLTLVVVSSAAVSCGDRSIVPTDGGPADDSGVDARSGDGSTACLINASCRKGEYCHLEGSCVASAAKPGRCRPRPAGCAKNLAPVCGCDGNSYDNACNAHLAGANVASAGRCEPTDPTCSGVQCHVVNNCCSCVASRNAFSAPPCPAICESPRCEAQGIGKPFAYCLKGHCLLGDGLDPCVVDSDCQKADDCCYCLALPKKVAPPPCPADCFTGQCTSLGLEAAKPRCVAGTCRLAL